MEFNLFLSLHIHDYEQKLCLTFAVTNILFTDVFENSSVSAALFKLLKIEVPWHLEHNELCTTAKITAYFDKWLAREFERDALPI